MTITAARTFRGAEFVLLYGLLPLLPLTGNLPRPWLVWLYVLSVPAAVWLRRSGGLSITEFWRPSEISRERDHLSLLLKRFLLSAIALSVGTWLLAPEQFLRLPLEDPLMWVGVIILYPLLAVYPQELLYRAFFLRRYTPLLGSASTLLLVNAVAFGWTHVAFGHPLSILLSAVGGVFFFHTYRSTGSLRLACLEHALYGDLIFTVGLGGYFYSGWANA